VIDPAESIWECRLLPVVHLAPVGGETSKDDNIGEADLLANKEHPHTHVLVDRGGEVCLTLAHRHLTEHRHFVSFLGVDFTHHDLFQVTRL